MLNAGISSGLFYRIMGDKLLHKLGAGLQYHKGLLKANQNSEATYDNSNSNYFNYQLSYRIECQVTPRTNIFFQPTFTHVIRVREQLKEPLTIKPYRAAISIGMLYHF